MPQARSSGKSPTTGAKPKTAGATTKRPAARATTAGKSAAGAAKPPAASATTRATRATGAKATATTSAKATKPAPSAKATKPAPSAKAASGARSTGSTSSAHAADARLDAAAQRVRRLNERIIEAGKEAGETTLTSYEKALKAIAGTIERRAGSTEIDWISNLATTQAKFIRDVTDVWTKAAREMLKK
jgi:hypothetical protein